MAADMDGREIVRRRLAGNGVSAPFASPLDCVRALVGIQAQFQQWAEVSLLNRSPAGLSMGDLSGFYQNHDLINLWGQRHTLHTYVQDDWEAISDLYEPRLAARHYAHRQYPEDFAYLTERIAGECAQGRTISRARLMALVEERLGHRPPDELYFDYTLIILSCLRGVFFGQPEKPGLKNFVGRERIRETPWQPDQGRAGAALESLMLRYFQAYGPASLADFGHWSGLPAGSAKAALKRLEGRLRVQAHAGREYFSLGEAEGLAGGREVYLLGKFDPLMVAYRHKDWLIPAKLEKQVWRSAGWVEGLIISGDQAVGTWRHSLKGRKMSLMVSPFTAIKTLARKKIQARAERLAHFWEKELDSVDFDGRL